MKLISTFHYTTHLSKTFVVEARNTKKSMKYREILKVGQVKDVTAVLLISIKESKDNIICSTSKAIWAAKLKRLLPVFLSTLSLSSCSDGFSASFPISITASTAERDRGKNQHFYRSNWEVESSTVLMIYERL